MGIIPQMEPWFSKEEKKAIIDYLDSDPWLTEHKKTEELEKKIADFIGTRYCTMVSNGTVSLITALSALGVKRDDVVLVPDYTMIATATAATLCGAKVKFVDVELDSLCVSYESLVNKVEYLGSVKCLILVSINGRYPFQIENILDFCHDNDIIVLEDAAQSLGSFFCNKHVGTLGEIGSFSLSTPKIISTGQGGFLVTDNKKLDEDIKAIKNFGRREAGVDKFDLMGWNFKYTDLQAVIGLEQMKKLPQRIKIKRDNYELYRELLEKEEKLEFILTNTNSTTPWMNDILLKVYRRNFIEGLSKRGIGTRPFYPVVHTTAPYLDRKWKYPYSTEVSERGLWLPSSCKLTSENIEFVCNSIKEVLK